MEAEVLPIIAKATMSMRLLTTRRLLKLTHRMPLCWFIVVMPIMTQETTIRPLLTTPNLLKLIRA
ncbi:hypothetical protein MBAV_000758 [Candidatus Magnetobacterium bavaricum]|uniref:Uncharacterized protein n=1 Tax=Candidatus Magnetobacterium bavaricum TaxID=29290 RepID=A0A0F3H286_9BACT|nr:hypothetical protein MBAV_000758 [Candidatus Magnetobacterium bavaricum]